MNVTAVKSGRSALELLEAAKHDLQPYELVILDCHMPEMDGFMVAEHIRQTWGLSQPIILMVTSATQNGDLARCRELGIDSHLTKPVRQQELLAAIRGVLETKGTVDRVLPVDKPDVMPVTDTLRLLLAEDNSVNQRFAVRILEKWGHFVHVVSNGREAVEAVADQQFDAVLMDVQMPEMGGYEATRLIRQAESSSGRHIPIIAMTAHAMKGDREKCLSAGMDAYVAKPISPRELAAVLQATVRRCAPGPAPKATAGDFAAKRQIILQRMDGDAELLRELAAAFIVNSEELIKEMRSAIDAHDFTALRRAAHTYKGSAALFELSNIVERSHSLELMAEERNLQEAATLVVDLETCTGDARNFLRSLTEEIPCAS
jgi:CheY-like chemotaxis protein